MNKFLSLFTLLFLFSTATFAQKSLLQSGPMLGYTEMREVLLWVQTNAEAEIQFSYWTQDSLGKRNSEILHTAKVKTHQKNGFAAKAIADKVLPGQTYFYELKINGQPIVFDYPTTFESQPLWMWRTDPPEFKMALGSCTYINEPIFDRPGKGYGREYGIFNKIYEKQPDAMLWLGDNTYLREADWYTWTGILHRYTHTRSLPELQPLLASTHHFAIWDDHDFGPNDSDRSFVHKDKTLEAFDLFWGNPTTGLPQFEGGITTAFQWNDVEFILLDNRYFRSPNDRKTGERTILGEEQFEWLIDKLASSKATFKMVAIGGQVLNTYEKWENYIHHHFKERGRLLKRLEEENIKNVVFLSGDRHHSELSKMVNGAGNSVYDLTCSPLTSGAGPRNEENRLRVDGTMVANQTNFGMLTFSGLRKERKMTMQIFDKDGQEIWKREIMAE